MLKLNLIFLLLLFLHANCDDVTFKNVNIKIIRRFSPPIETHIEYAKRLKDIVTENLGAIEIRNQNIPVLYPGSISDVNNILSINDCNVEEIKPGAFTNAELTTLNFRGNRIKTIDYGVFNNVSIELLDLSFNEISTIHPQAFDDMTSLVSIFLDHNEIKVWNPEWFKNTPGLMTMYFQNNEIQKLPAHAFKNIKGRKLSDENTFSHVDLIFSNNKIKEIDLEAFADLEKIGELDLNNNLLEVFDDNLLKNIKIKKMVLSNNKIKCLGNFSDILKAEEVNSIDSNPMYCDCLDKVKEYAQNHLDRKITFSQITCKTHHED